MHPPTSFAAVSDFAAVLAAEKPNQIFFPGDINEFYWGSLAFLVVVAFLAWRVFPAVGKMMRANSDKIAGELQTAEATREQSEQRTASLKQQLGDIDSKKQELLGEARQGAAELEADLMARAEAEARQIRDKGASELELMRRQATADLQAEVAGWVMGAAEALVEEVLQDDRATQDNLVESYISRDLQQLTQVSSP